MQRRWPAIPHTCAANARNAAYHIWDRRDAAGHMGAAACVVVPAFWDRFRGEGDWQRRAWWIHDHLPYSRITFYRTRFAFNIGWHEQPVRTIYSRVVPTRFLTKPGWANHGGSQEAAWRAIVPLA